MVPQMLTLDRRRIRRSFEERFTASRMAKDYLQVYRSLLNRVRSPIIKTCVQGSRPPCRTK